MPPRRRGSEHLSLFRPGMGMRLFKSADFLPDRYSMSNVDDALEPPCAEQVDLRLSVEAGGVPAFERPLAASVREALLLDKAPWTRSLGKLALDVTTQGWKFPPSWKDEGGRMK